MESPLNKLKKLVGESEEIRKGNLSGKKKHIARKMKYRMTAKQKEDMHKRDGVKNKEPLDFTGASDDDYR